MHKRTVNSNSISSPASRTDRRVHNMEQRMYSTKNIRSKLLPYCRSVLLLLRIGDGSGMKYKLDESIPVRAATRKTIAKDQVNARAILKKTKDYSTFNRKKHVNK